MHWLLHFLPFLFLIQNTARSACIDVERTALLTFKSKLKDPRSLLSTWKEQNCCSWKGVTCHNESGHVVKLNLRYPFFEPYRGHSFSLNGEIDSSLLSLRKLTHLDLSGNNFNETEIPNFIGQFENLVYLNLSFTKFVGKIPTEMGNLKRLRYLDMSDTFFVGGSIPLQLGNISTLSFLSFRYNGRLETKNIEWISKLNSLQYLDMSFLKLSSFTDWFHALNKLKNLKVLILGACGLQNIPAYVDSLNLTRLTILDLSANMFGSPVPSWFGNLTSISHLDLSFAGFQGLSIGFWSDSKERICHLRYLDLTQINITEDITDFVRRFTCSWKIIEVLSLPYNYFNGSLLTGWLPTMSCLEYLDLQQNSITGNLPTEIVKLSKLRYLDLSNNRLEGIVSQNHLENLTQLEVLHLSLNMLKLVVDHSWHPKFQLRKLELQACDVGPLFPSWLKSQTQISFLNLQNSSIIDSFPAWFSGPSYFYIDLSYNNLHGKLSHKLQMSNLKVLILASNNLEGSIKSLPVDLAVLDISNNKFSGTLQWVTNMSQVHFFSARNSSFIGEIPSPICEMASIFLLVLSNNMLSGIVLNCVSKLKSLEILDISFNNLSGNIPNSIGSMVNLKSLALHGNILTGELPTNLQHCRRLSFLDLGNNKFTGKVPKWIGVSLTELLYLQLRENNFNGNIPSELTLLSSLQVLDIARNNLEGPIPDSFGNFSAMKFIEKFHIKTHYYWGPDINHLISSTIDDSLTLTIKGEIIEYSNTLYLVNSIDLSGNNLIGSIPNEIVALKGLENLNLSRNNLHGKIPKKIGKIKALESLDLSFNKLSGEIPQSMSELTFLSHLNLSYNNLSGPIPVGNQLNTLNDSYVYIGNDFLCGGPMNRSCSVRSRKDNISDGKNNSTHNLGLYLSIGVGFVVGWLVVWCILQLGSTWSTVFFEKVDHLYYKFIKD